MQSVATLLLRDGERLRGLGDRRLAGVNCGQHVNPPHGVHSTYALTGESVLIAGLDVGDGDVDRASVEGDALRDL